MTFRELWRGRFAAGLAVMLATLPTAAAAQLRTVEEQKTTANDGTPFVVTKAVVRVPERRSNGRSSGSIDLAVVRVRQQGKGPGPVHMLLAGGPGDSGVDEVLSLARQGGAAWFGLMGGDVVGIDQRGTGASRPSLSSNVRYDLPLDRPGSPEAWLPEIRDASSREAARLRGQGIVLQAYNTEESADDVDAVRRAFGYGKMIVWGRSYGSHLALTTLRRHPEGVARMILVGPEGPDHTWKSPAQVDDVIARIATRAGAPELIGNMRAVLDALAHTPVKVAVVDPATRADRTIIFGKFDVQLVVAQAIGDPRAVAGLPAAFRTMAAGDYRGMAQLIYAARSKMAVQSAMKQVMDISSGASDARLARIREEASSALLGNAMNFPGMYLASAWQVTPLPPAFQKPIRSPVPVLIIVGDLDARTPVANAREIAATLSDVRIIVMENATHQFSVFSNPVLRERLERFLSDQPVEGGPITLPALPFQR